MVDAVRSLITNRARQATPRQAAAAAHVARMRPGDGHAIKAELERAHAAFHALLRSLSATDWSRPSLNAGWTNGEIMAHMLFGFIILYALLPMVRIWGRLPKASSRPFAWLLNAITGPFNWFNALGARMQGKVFTYGRVGKLFDWVYSGLLKQMDSVSDDEWSRGMYYPTRWDSNFDEFMTVGKLFHYAVKHFDFHTGQLRFPEH